MVGQFGLVIDNGMRRVQMNGKTPEKVLRLPAVNSYALCNDMTLHCHPQQAILLNAVNGSAVVILLRCSDLDHSEVPLVHGPALITAPGG